MFFQVLGIDDHLAALNLFMRCAMETELTNAQSIFGADGRAKDAAGHGTGIVEFAQSGLRIESGTGLVISEIFKATAGLFSVRENSRDRIARKACRQTGHCLLRTLMDCCGSIWSERLQIAKTFRQAGSVELIDGKDTDAALGTSGAAREPISGTAG